MSGIPAHLLRRMAGMTPDVPAAEAARILESKGLRHIAVVQGDDLFGVVTAEDLAHADPGTPVASIASMLPTVPCNASLEEARRVMEENGTGFVAVLAGGLLLGVIDERAERARSERPDGPDDCDWITIGPVS